jgi:hypothetical protein
MKALFDPPSIEAGEQTELVMSELALDTAVNLQVSIVKIEQDGDEVVVSWGQDVPASTDCIRTPVRGNVTLEEGSYALGQVAAIRDESRVVLTGDDFEVPLLEVRRPGDTASTTEEIDARVTAVREAREREFLSGLGLSGGTPGARDYGVLIFVKDCLLTRHMRLGQYEVISFGGLGVSDEVTLVQEYLRAYTEESMPDDIARTLADKGKTQQPSFVAHFPLVRALSPSDAATCAHNEVLVLCGVLAVTRRAYPSVFAALVLDLETHQWNPWVNTRNYTGNLLGGSISGEDPRTTRKHSERARGDERIQLYLSLYRDALDAVEPEAKYFRLWSLLEVMAAQRVPKRDALLDWGGSPAPVPNGSKYRHNIRSKDELVFEYLRQTVGRSHVNFNYGSQVKQSDWRDLVTIWYAHRNCLAHDGGCRPHDAAQCDQSPARVKCRAAHDEVSAAVLDHYLSILVDTVQDALYSELA